MTCRYHMRVAVALSEGYTKNAFTKRDEAIHFLKYYHQHTHNFPS